MIDSWALSELEGEQAMVQAVLLSDALKERTDGHHQSIESVKRFGRLFAEDYSQAEYVDLLKKFYGFFVPLEQQFVQHHDWLPELSLETRLRGPRLAEDLKSLGIESSAIDGLPLCQELPDLSNAARMMGCWYVLEGSTLGGQGIARKLQTQLGLAPGEGISFYYGHGAETMPQWKAFKDVMNTHFTVERDLDDIAYAAGETFQSLSRWMSQN